jgi:hypothetical protein
VGNNRKGAAFLNLVSHVAHKYILQQLKMPTGNRLHAAFLPHVVVYPRIPGFSTPNPLKKDRFCNLCEPALLQIVEQSHENPNFVRMGFALEIRNPPGKPGPSLPQIVD